MTTHTITLARHTAQVVGLMGVLVLGTWDSYGTEQLLLRHGPEWEGLAIDATFHNVPNDEGVTVLADTDGLVTVPPEAVCEHPSTPPSHSGACRTVYSASAAICPTWCWITRRCPVPTAPPPPAENAQALTQMQDLRDGAVDAKNQAEAARDAAANSATAAAASEKNAAASATAAKTAQSAAETAKAGAETAQKAAASSASSASTSASTATTQAAAAKSSATTAKASEAAAAKSAKEAAASAANLDSAVNTATQKAAAASASAEAAKASENAVAKSAIASSGSATAAKASETAAAKSADDAKNYAAQVAGIVTSQTIFGVNFSGSTSAGTRVGAAKDFVFVPGTDTSMGQNSFDAVYPWAGMRRCCCTLNADGTVKVNAYKGQPGYIEDGTNGEVLVEIPLFYVSGMLDVAPSISMSMLPGYRAPRKFLNADGSLKQKCYVRAFPGSIGADGKLHSIAGAVPTGNRNITQFLAAARKWGDTYSIGTSADFEVLAYLMIVVYGTRHAQSKINGCTSLYSTNLAVAAATDNAASVVVAKGASIEPGMVISIGSGGENEAIAKRRIVTSVETIDGDATNVKVNFDGDPVTTTTDHKVWRMMQSTGTANSVIATCGSPVSNTDGRHSFVFYGVENPLYGNQCTSSVTGSWLTAYHTGAMTPQSTAGHPTMATLPLTLWQCRTKVGRPPCSRMIVRPTCRSPSLLAAILVLTWQTISISIRPEPVSFCVAAAPAAAATPARSTSTSRMARATPGGTAAATFLSPVKRGFGDRKAPTKLTDIDRLQKHKENDYTW
mgnify:CR=1 FL=1